MNGFFAQPTLIVLLLLFVFCHSVFAVDCIHCNNNIGADHDSADCPLLKLVATNAANLAKGLAATVATILPMRLVKFLTKPILERLAKLGNKLASDGTFDTTSKTASEIAAAVESGVLSVSEARAYALDLGEDADAKIQRRGDQILKFLTSLKEDSSEVSASVRSGALLFVLARACEYVQQQKGSSLKASISDDGKLPNSKLSSTITPPKNVFECDMVLTVFQQIAHATSLAQYLAVSTFLTEVYHLPLVRQSWSFEMGFCHILAYLHRVEDPSFPSVNLNNVLASGSGDSLKDEAKVLGSSLYGPSFRVLRGDPRGPTADDKSKDEGADIKYNGKGCSNIKAPICKVWNAGGVHKSSQLEADGTCKARHVCNKWISNGEPFEKCGGAHNYKECDHPHKCDEPKRK